MPVAAVAYQARGFHAEHGTEAPAAQSAEHALEARPLGARAGASRIIVDDFPILPDKFARSAGACCRRWLSRLFCTRSRADWRIKQRLRIKRFFGTSETAVKSQPWITVAAYVRVAIAKKRLNLDLSVHSMLHIPSVTPFENVPLLPLLTDSAPPSDQYAVGKQPILLRNILNTNDYGLLSQLG